MCGIVLASDMREFLLMMDLLAHRGRDGSRFTTYRGLHLGLNRLAIVNTDTGHQPVTTPSSVLAFNGEIYNQNELYYGMLSDDHKAKPRKNTEAYIIEALTRRNPRNFERFLDGYYAFVRIDKGRQRVIVARDFLGVMPLYYQRDPFAVASESKALNKPKEVPPGATLEFTLEGKLTHKHIYDPVSLHMEGMDMDHLEQLFLRAVRRRFAHSERPVCLALSGGLDSSLVLAACAKLGLKLHCITICVNPQSNEAIYAQWVAEHYGMKHHLVTITPDMIEEHRERILYHLEDPIHNPIKYAAMIRNYFTAQWAPGVVILCGEGADEIGGGYPPHLARQGLELEWKCYSTLRSMHAINLDRVNKGGMAHTREFRTPFLDRALVLYCMGCHKRSGKGHFRELAKRLGVPEYVLNKSKYSSEEDALWQIVSGWGKTQSRSPPNEKKQSTTHSTTVEPTILTR